MSLFWKYFLKTLNYLPLHKSKALACIIEGLAAYLDNIRLDIIKARNQYIIHLSDNSLLSLYGLSRNITRSQYDNDETYKTRVLNAYKWISLGGKVEGMLTILKDYGFPKAEFRNLREIDPLKWAEFEFTYPENLLISDMEKIVAIINQYKPARSRLTKMNTPITNAGTYYYAGITRHIRKINIMMDTEININKNNTLHFGGLSKIYFIIRGEYNGSSAN